MYCLHRLIALFHPHHETTHQSTELVKAYVAWVDSVRDVWKGHARHLLQSLQSLIPAWNYYPAFACDMEEIAEKMWVLFPGGMRESDRLYMEGCNIYENETCKSGAPAPCADDGISIMYCGIPHRLKIFRI